MMTRRWAASAAFLSALAAAAAPASAHPHVWIEMRSDVVFDEQGQITAMNLMWTFDDGYAQMAIDGLDANGDGVYSTSELEPLTKENIASLKDYEFFTVMRFNGQKQALGEVTEFGQIWSNDKLQLHMRVPLQTPVDPTKGEFVAKVYDPDFFIAMDYAKDEPVTVIGAMPKNCSIVMKPVPSDTEIEETRAMLSTKGPEWKPENDEDFGALFAQPVAVQCKA
jgi:ABC-type uncharacterized transport system substrate-binding protein